MRIDSETGEPILTANEEHLENERLDAEDRADRAEDGLGEILDCIEAIIEAAKRIQVICGGGVVGLKRPSENAPVSGLRSREAGCSA